MSRLSKNYFQQKAIRDPLYGFVDLSELEIRVVDSEFFRRLLLIKQLSHAYVVYPTAIHTRFEHSLGAMYMADQMAKKLNISNGDREIVRLAALLHDVGHGPFSHLFEPAICRINPEHKDPHEKISQIIVKEDPELDIILGNKKNDVVDLLKNSSDDTHESDKPLASIISSGLDADKLDYMRRDSYHIGVSYGQFDLHRILHNLSTTKGGSKVLIESGGKDALESYRLARYLMHAQVYEHHARLAADNMFKHAIDIAIDEENVIDKNHLKFSTSGSNEEFLKTYKTLDDHSIYQKILENDRSKISKEILLNIRKRKLLKRACEFIPDSLNDTADKKKAFMKMSVDELNELSNRIAKSMGLAPHEVIFYISKINMKLYKEGEILFRYKGKILDLSSISPITAKDDVIKYYVYGPEDLNTRKTIAKKTASALGLTLTSILHV